MVPHSVAKLANGLYHEISASTTNPNLREAIPVSALGFQTLLRCDLSIILQRAAILVAVQPTPIVNFSRSNTIQNGYIILLGLFVLQKSRVPLSAS